MVQKINVLPIINTSYKTFTKSEKMVAELVVKDPRHILYSSITDLAYEAKVGETTVLRFCRKIGFNGYQSFKMTLAQSIQIDDGMSEQLSDEITKEDTLIEVSKKILNVNIGALNETFQLLDYRELKKAIDYLFYAKRIVFFGVGSSAVTACEAKNKFIRIRPNVEATFDAHIQSMIASLMDSEDIAVGFSYSGSTKDTVDVMKLAKNNGSKTICITRFAKSPITKYADVVLLVGAKEGPFQGGSLSTKMAQLYMIDILYTEYFRKNSELAKENKERTSSSISDKMY